MTKNLLLKLFFFNAICIQSIGAVPFFSNTPLDGLRNSVADYNVDQFREILKAAYHFHIVNKLMSFDVETALLRKCEHKSLDTARLYEILHDFQTLKKSIKETREKSRAEYFYKGAGLAAAGIILDVVALYCTNNASDKWQEMTMKGTASFAPFYIGGLCVSSLPAFYYAKGQLGKAWNYEENRTKLAAIEQDIHQIAKIIHDRAQSFADDDTKKVLKNFVEEMNISGAQR